MATVLDQPTLPEPADESAAIAAAQKRAAPSSNLAVAARRFGDHFPLLRRQRPIRLSGVLVMALMLFYVPWLFTHLNTAIPWLAWPFLVANILSAVCVTLSVFNGWSAKVTPRRPFVGLEAPEVAVIIPTWGEPVPMVLRTVLSVLEDDYPRDCLHVVVSDDAQNPELVAALDGLGVIYHEPPPRNAPGRDGAAKAGNLNSALELVLSCFPSVEYIETRDADDEVGTQNFLRHTVGQLEFDERLAFVQTIKEAQVSAGDPFVNLDGQFYRCQMLSRNFANAVFPCGSGPRLAPSGARGHRRLPDVEPRRGPPVGRRSAPAGMAWLLPDDRRRGRSARSRGCRQRLQAARDVGDRHGPPRCLGQPPRAQPQAAPPVHRDIPLLPALVHRARLRTVHRPRLPGRGAG